MEYQVPQFIEVEDKIFGPLTLFQFIFLAGGIGIGVVLVLNFGVFVGVLLSLPFVGGGAALAFVNINGKPFSAILESAFNYYSGKRLYLWKREAPQVNPTLTPQAQTESVLPLQQQSGLSRRKLEDLAWSLDIKEVTPPQQ